MSEIKNKLLKWRNKKNQDNLVNKHDISVSTVQDDLINLMKKNIEDSNNMFAILRNCIYNSEAKDKKPLNVNKVQPINNHVFEDRKSQKIKVQQINKYACSSLFAGKVQQNKAVYEDKKSQEKKVQQINKDVYEDKKSQKTNSQQINKDVCEDGISQKNKVHQTNKDLYEDIKSLNTKIQRNNKYIYEDIKSQKTKAQQTNNNVYVDRKSQTNKVQNINTELVHRKLGKTKVQQTNKDVYMDRIAQNKKVQKLNTEKVHRKLQKTKVQQTNNGVCENRKSLKTKISDLFRVGRGEKATKRLQDWINVISNQNNCFFDELQENSKITMEEVIRNKYDDENSLSTVVDVRYHDVDEVDMEENMKSGTVTFTNRDSFEGYFSHDMKKRIGTCHKNIPHNHLGTTGTWISGVLEGKAVIENCYGGYEETFFKRGVKHGYSRSFGPQPKRKDNLWQVAFYKNGKMHGHFWQGCLGGGYITGVSEDNEITGDNIAFLFPNFKDGILGKFVKGKLISGVNVKLVNVEIVNGIAVGSFSRPMNASVLIRDNSTPYSLSMHPLQPDIHEHARVEVKQSNTPDSGEGLFAKTVFSEGDLVSILNGVRMSPSTQDEWSDYKVNFNTALDLDVPANMRRLDQYCATLAHKANHSFCPNTRWGRLDHPRFGMVVTILAAKSIKVGEELTVNYKYPITVAPQWYKDCYKMFFGEKRVAKIY